MNWQSLSLTRKVSDAPAAGAGYHPSSKQRALEKSLQGVKKLWPLNTHKTQYPHHEREKNDESTFKENWYKYAKEKHIR